MKGKLYHISDVLSISTGLLVSTRHIEGCYDILGFMTGEELYTHQLPRAFDECKPAIIAQHPELATVEKRTDLKDDSIRAAWLAEQAARFGEYMEISPLPRRSPQYDTPIADAIEMMGDATKVLVIEP